MADDDKEPNDDDDAVMDSDEEDEDYDPTADPDAALLADEDENDAGAATAGDTTEDAPARLSITKQKAVDDAFFDLFGYHYNNSNNAIPSFSSGGKSDDKLATKSNKRTISKQRSILSSIFGRHSSVKLMTYAKATAAMARSKPCSAGGMLRLEKRTITEVKRFAGQEIKVEKVVMVPVMASSCCEEENNAQQQQQPAAAAAATAAMQQSKTTQKPKGVDNLLTELSRPEKLSTISKTSTDWDLFKSKNADASLKEQLESRAEGNEAYLVKKDFLNRVDGRRFELEKKDRDRERSKRGK